MESEDSLISFREATFCSDGQRVLPGTNWDVFEGTHWVVLGSNGAGKRLLLRALEGKLPCCEGEAHYCSDAGVSKAPLVVCLYPDTHRELARGESLPEARWESMFRDGFPIVEEYLKSISSNTQDILETARLLEITNLLDRRLIALSNGESRKVCIAGALLQKPKILALSEPFLAVDKDYREYLKGVLRRLMNSSLTVIVSLSDPQDLFLGINSAIYLENGRQTYIGDLQGALELMEVDHQPCSENPSSQCDSEAGRPEGNGDVIVQMCDITLRYGETEVLRGLDWTIRTDERWALLGSNGAGKSALISLLVGHNPQCYVNNVSVLGRRRGSGESIWDIKRHIGFMASELFRIIPSHRSCLDTVMSGYQQVPEFVGVPNSSQIEGALRMLELVGLRKQAYQPLGTLANGSQRLVLLARAVVHKPAIVVLDEPCENLDRAHRNRFDSCLDSIASELNLPFVLATHRLKELPSCLTHVMVLEAGKVAQIWTPNCQSSLLYCETN